MLKQIAKMPFNERIIIIGQNLENILDGAAVYFPLFKKS